MQDSNTLGSGIQTVPQLVSYYNQPIHEPVLPERYYQYRYPCQGWAMGLKPPTYLKQEM